MAALNLAGKTSGYIKLKSPDVALNATVELPNKDGILATLDDIGTGGGGSGGGDYTPEKLVWEDKTSERPTNTEFTNTNDVPLYVQLAIFTDGNVEDNYCEFILDGVPTGASGIIGSKSWNNPLYIVPAGSTYKARIAGSTTLSTWREARMPLAVASGGETATLESLGIPNHDKVTVYANGNALFGVKNFSAGVNGVEIGSILRIRTSIPEIINGVHITFLNPNGEVGTITTEGNETKYNTSSDYRLKNNVAPMSGSIDKLKQLKPSTWTWKSDGSHGQGFVAHEVQKVVPQAVSGIKDAMRTEEYEVTPAVTDNKGNITTASVMGTREVPDYQGIDQSKLVPLLTSALQEAIVKIEEVETRLADRDKLIDKLVAKVEALEEKLKKVK